MMRAKARYTIQARALIYWGWIVLAGLLAGCGQPAFGASPTPPAPPSAYPNGTLLITAPQLAAELGDTQLRLLDARPLHAYNAGHIPGARHAWWQDTIEVHNDIYGMLTGETGRAALVQAWGIRPGVHVVVYDDQGGRDAARILWVLHVLGFRAVQILDGGWQAWQAANLPITRTVPLSSSAGDWPVSQLDYRVLIGAEDVLRIVQTHSALIIDDRIPAERDETWNGQLRRGHIPGAIHWPWDQLFTPGPIPFIRPPHELQAELAALGITPDRPIVVYGLDGPHAAIAYLAFTLLGYPSVRVYDGSWAQWGSSKSTMPVELSQ